MKAYLRRLPAALLLGALWVWAFPIAIAWPQRLAERNWQMAMQRPEALAFALFGSSIFCLCLLLGRVVWVPAIIVARATKEGTKK